MREGAAIGPAVAGTWYPRDPDELARLVDRLLDHGREQAPPRLSPVALIVPHAGFVYSGAVAAAAFAKLRGLSFDRIVIAGPSHHFAFRGAAIPEAASVYRTPLGAVPIDRDALTALRGAPSVFADDRMFAPEHAIEAELPFLQRVLGGDVPIVPVLLGGGATGDDAARVAEALSPLLTDRALLVVSSDFTHFGPRFDFVPFVDDVPARIRALDFGAIAAIEAGDADSFARYVATTGATICGHRAIEAMLRLPLARGGGTTIRYDTSGRVTGAWDHSVSYAALAFSAPGGEA